MASIKYDEYKVKLNNLRPTLDNLGQSLGLEAAAEELDLLQAQSAAEDFWSNMEKAQKVSQRIKNLQDKLDAQQKRLDTVEDLLVLCEMGQEADDDSMVEELEESYTKLEEDIESARLATLFTGEYDSNDCMLTIHAGAGGTEAQDWASMLFRMYQHWCDRHNFKCETLDYEDGDEAGLKSATMMITGENAYGYLRSEHGVHRLVRISPFDSNARRQTSFAAVEVMPDLPDDVEVDIRPEDIEMQVFRSSGAGGQHINKTSSAVRLIHKPTGVVVSSQQERSQFQNRETCYLKGVQMKIEWGSQIRSYVFMPYTMVKDTRTAFETSNVNAVMDGDLDGFINAYLTCEATGTWATK